VRKSAQDVCARSIERQRPYTSGIRRKRDHSFPADVAEGRSFGDLSLDNLEFRRGAGSEVPVFGLPMKVGMRGVSFGSSIVISRARDIR
jgi:hypothetical protein